MTPCKDQDYFDRISAADQHTTVVLIGEPDEQWTLLAQSELRKANVSFCFFSWSELKEARIASEWIRFPVLQFWNEGELSTEIIGFSQDRYRRFAHAFAKI